MLSSSTLGVRRAGPALAVTLAVVTALLLPAAAGASHTAHMGNVALVQPGCQAKGLLAFAAGNSGGLASGRYAYTVTAIVGAAETTPCGAQAVAVSNGATPTSTSQALVQWNAVPDAVGYKIYRAPLDPVTGAPTGPFQALIFAAGPVTTLPPGAVCPPGGAGTGPRCAFQDSGGPTASGVNPPPFAAAWDGVERHPDLRIVQCVDYGGTALTACPNTAPSAGDDPFTGDTSESAPALKTDLLHFPPGLTPDPLAAASVCKLSGPAPSLIGDPDVYGSDDPDEDTCPRESLVGTAQTLSRSSTGLTLTGGDIYVGTPKAGEPGRLYIVLRPACSAGSPIKPGSPTCNAVLGGSNYEVEKEFLAAASSFVKRGDGSYGIDSNTVTAEDDGPLEPYLNVLVPTPSLQRLGKAPVQVRQLTQNLFGYADQATSATSDDRAFVNLPSSCGDKGIGADKTTWDDPTVSSASGPFNMGQSYCDMLPFAPKISGTVGGEGRTAQGASPDLDVTITQDASEAPSKSVKVTLPATLGTNLVALGNTCSQSQFDGGTCPANSVVGSAKAVSPLVGPLTGPAYLVAQPGGLPKLVVSLRGAVAIDLEGTIDIAGGTRIVNLFSNIPDTPLTSFTLHVNGGDNGLLKNTSDLCDGTGAADGEFTAHSGKTATASATLARSGSCQPKPDDIGVSKRAKLAIKLARVKSGKPTLRFTVRRGSSSEASKISSARLTLPKGLRIIRNYRLENRLSVRATPDLLPITQLRVGKRLLLVDKIPGGPVVKVAEKFRRRALKSSGSLRRKGRKTRATFKVRVETYGGKTYNYRVKVRPKS